MRVSHPTRHMTHWSCDHLICRKALSPLSVRQWPPILAMCDIRWVDRNHRVTCPIYHVITLFSQKGGSPVSQRQWQLKLVGLWVRVKGTHLLFQLTCRSSDHVNFEKCHVSTKARPWNSAGDIKHITNQSFLCIQKISTFDSHQYTSL